MVEVGNRQYLISGGIDFGLKDITSSCFLYDVPTHSVRRAASMHQPRYTHAALRTVEEVVVVGGRFFGEDEVAILASCEAYSPAQDAWRLLPSLNVKRCTSYAMLWREDVYVFGGYTGPFERSQSIERLNWPANKWEVLDFQLSRGIESGCVLSRSSNEVTILGGNTNSGPTASVITLNFHHRTVRSHRHLKDQKMLHKGFALGDQVYIFGGSHKGELEIYDLALNQAEVVDASLN
jgi:hypothetical protein